MVEIDGAKLKALRDARMWSLRELAEASGVDYTAISLMERGKRNPHQRTVRDLASALGVEPAELLKQESRRLDEPT